MPAHHPRQPFRKRVACLLALLTAALLPAQALPAQTAPTPPDSIWQVFAYAEQMPTLPGVPSGKPVVPAIIGKLRELLEPAARGDKRVFVTFIVGPSGCVYGAKIIKGVSAVADVAVLRAVARLPRFVPGRQGGRPVSVVFTVPVAVK